MAQSSEWTEWHLPPRGWERGSELEDFNYLIERCTPVDCVMTVRYSEVMSTSFSPVTEITHTLWQDSDQHLVSSLLDKYGPAPARL